MRGRLRLNNRKAKEQQTQQRRHPAAVIDAGAVAMLALPGRDSVPMQQLFSDMIPDQPCILDKKVIVGPEQIAAPVGRQGGRRKGGGGGGGLTGGSYMMPVRDRPSNSLLGTTDPSLELPRAQLRPPRL